MKSIEMEKAYNPAEFEDRLYEKWEKDGYFKPSSDKNSPIHTTYNETKKSYTVVIPPPNVTGILHMGHGLNNCLQDISVRYHRMNGENTLWVPGTDHAGIATQNIVERQLQKQGLTRQKLGRDAFVEKTWEVKKEHHEIITKQQRKLGNSVDWNRERFTMDAGLSKAVRKVFVTLYERGLIYRGKYLVNWCPSCGTALADDEVEHEDISAAMYHMYYERCDGKGKIEIATTRPETLFGDTAVAVHPEDDRYTSLIGKKVKLALTNREIPVVADTYVDREFGTGVVKITPAHDPNDWLLGKRHNLEVINVLNDDATLNENVPEKYRLMDCKTARALVIEDLKAENLYKTEEAITHPVGHCYRCHSVVEPYLSEQWFVKMEPLAKKAIKCWKDGDITFYPKKWENTYKHWMENIRDWCISRQLWWGHRIPVWYCQACGEMIVALEDPVVCSKCGAKDDTLKQDEDVLDTWFSSWLWPFSTLGWPDKTSDMHLFYPTTALVTAYDIIFFWVSRMIMAGLEFTGKAPFTDIYIHSLVKDKKGRKMSKSLGNGLDPLELISEYGSDAIKFTLGFLCAQGQDVLVDKTSFKLGSHFANKIWNASRYILGNLEGRTLVPVKDSDLTELDLWIYSCLNTAVKKSRIGIENYRYNDAAQAMYEFFWNEFCDWYVEGTKLSFWNGSDEEKDRAVSVLLHVMEESLRLLHPYLPFITEEIYSKLPLAKMVKNRKAVASANNKIVTTSDWTGMLIVAPFPTGTDERENKKTTARFTVLQDLIRSIRALRAECGISPDTKLEIALMITKDSNAEVCVEKKDLIKLLAGVKSIQFVDNKPESAIGAVGEGFEAFILIGGGSVDISQ
ncbi:MAG TPA: valine--tRNA ligase, partial [Treponemataceae bacterium]|nr:valine--tRNA ligase [Treponemataceae bacterium]